MPLIYSGSHLWASSLQSSFSHRCTFWMVSPLSTVSGSLWMSCCDVILSHPRTQKCWGLFLLQKKTNKKQNIWILIPHIYVSCLEESIKSNVLVPKLHKCQVTSSSYCQRAGCRHHFSSDLSMFGKEKRNVIIMIRHYIKTEAKSLNVRPIKPHKHANFLVYMHNSCYLLCQCCVQGSTDIVNHRQSRDHFTTRGFILCLILSTWMAKFVLLTESMWERKEKRQQKMVILSMVKHCAIPELPSPDTTASSNVLLLQGWTDGVTCMTNKTSWFWSRGQRK